MTRVRFAALTLGVAIGLLVHSSPQAAPPLSDWTAPANLGPVVNSAWDDALPALSKDGLSLYFTSNRDGGFGSYDIWVSQRDDVASPWKPPANVGRAVNDTTVEAGPELSRDGHWLFFHSIRPDGYGGYDLMAAWRSDVHDDFGWQPAFNLGPVVNSAFNDAGPSFIEGEKNRTAQLYFGSDRPGLGSWDIYVADIDRDGVLGAARRVDELNSPVNDQKPAIRFDGLEIFFFSSRPGSRNQDIWTSTRASMRDPWSVPLNVASVNTPYNDVQCTLSGDGRMLVITSNQPGGFGATDLYVSTRTR